MTTLVGRFGTTPDAACRIRSVVLDSTAGCSKTTSPAAWRGLRARESRCHHRGRRRADRASAVRHPGAGPRPGGVSTAPTRTFTASWSGFSSNGSEMPDVVFIPADPGTNRFHSICACICGVGSFVAQGSRGLYRRARPAGRSCGRRAHAGFHPFAAGATDSRCAFLSRPRGGSAARPRSLATRARTEADALPLGSGAVAGTSYDVDVQGLARDLGFSRVVTNSIDASSDRDFAATFLHACDDHGPLEPTGRGPDHFCSDEHRFFDMADAAEHRQQPDASEKESRPARTRPRQSGPVHSVTCWLC